MALRHEVADLAEVAARAVQAVTSALLEADEDAALAIAAADLELDERASAVEGEILDLLALQAPVAGDLRFLLSTQRMAQEIERCGDLVASIARRVPRIPDQVLDSDLRALLYEMGAEAADMLAAAGRAYLAVDDRGASDVIGRDDHMDELHRRLLRSLLVDHGPNASLEPTVELALVGRFYERVADHAVVIAERVRFTVLGNLPPGDHDSA